MDNNLTLLFAASVLSLRGGNENVTKLSEQPFHDAQSENIFLWNGELFDSSLIKVEAGENDGLNIFNSLNKNTEGKTENDILKVFEDIKGKIFILFYFY